MVFENKQSLEDTMNTDILMYIDLLSIKLKKLREKTGEKKEYIDQITWL